jgi:hypothetical protein
MTKLEKAKEIVSKYYKVADCGIFNSRNILGDPMATVYAGEGLIVDVCFFYAYFEVFGLSIGEFEELEKFYEDLRKRKRG